MRDVALRRNSRDYAILLAVRKRRRTNLERELRQARSEHDHRLKEEALLATGVQRCLDTAKSYTAQLAGQTEAGRPVVLQELQATRDRSAALDTQLRTAQADLSRAARSVAAADLVSATATKRYKANEARIDSLAARNLDCRNALASAQELRDEDEVADLRRRPGLVV